MRVLYTLAGFILVNVLLGQNKLTVAADGFINIKGGTLNLHKASIVNDGRIEASNSEIKLTGDQLIRLEGTGHYELNDLTIDLSEKLYMEQDINLRESLNIVSGVIDIKNSILWLGEENGTIHGESNENYLFASGNGMIIKPFNFDQPQALDPGNLGLELTSLESLGGSQMIRTHDRMMLDGAESANRNYEIITEVAKRESIYLKAHYRDLELSTPLNDPSLWRIDAQGSRSLYSFGKGVNGAKGNYVESEVKGPLSIFTIGESRLNADLSSTPTAFTPNGDGKNDVFIIPFLEEHANAQVMIFNRWGEKVYESDNYVLNPWDGSWKGKVLDANTFYYNVKVPEQRKSIDGKISIVK